MRVMTLAEDLEADGEPEPEFVPGIATRMPRKIIAGGALVRDADGRVLFVEPAYKPFLDIPGGIAEPDESPLHACRREVAEELGLTISIGRLLVVDWVPAHGAWADSLQFVYDGGVLTPDLITAIRLDSAELLSLRFMTLDEATPYLRASKVRRIAQALAALNAGETRYAEFGRHSP